MKKFNSIIDMTSWFDNRSFDDEVSYIKSFSSQKIACASKQCNVFNVFCNEYIDTSLLMSNLDEVIELEKKLLLSESDGEVYEVWSLDRPKLLIWQKRLLKVGEEYYWFCHILPEMNISRVLFNNDNIIREWDFVEPVKFTQQELTIIYLCVHGFSNVQIGELLWIDKSTVKGHIYNKIGHKLTNAGYVAHTKERIIDICLSKGLGSHMPSVLAQRLKPTTALIVNKEPLTIAPTSFSNELDLR
jgi:hypothetical protein